MDTVTLIMGVILIAVVGVPVVFIGRKGKKAKRKLKELLTTAAARENCTISEYEIWEDSVIGTDKQNHVVFFVNAANGNNVVQNIHLAEIKSCKSNITGRTFDSNGRSVKIIDRLCLHFIPKNNKPEIELEFYNAEKGAQLFNELGTLEKWQKIVNEQLSVRTK